MTLTVRVHRLPHAADLPLPVYQSEGAAGMDLTAALPPGLTLVIEPGARDVVPTGIAIALPLGHEAQVRPRSGLALNHGITVLNAPGTVDSDYRGEIKVVLINLGSKPFPITRGSRIAQLVFAAVERGVFVEEPLDDTVRGAGGFGSTGLGGGS